MLLSLFALLPLSLSLSTSSSPSVIHVVTGNHLDVGFNARGPDVAEHTVATDMASAFAASVMARYTGVLDAQSFALGNSYIVQPWAAATAFENVSAILPCATVAGAPGPQCADGDDRVARTLQAMLENGTLSANGALFNAQVEFGTGPSLLRHLQVAASVVPAAARSATFSQRDVPGLTVSALPWLAAANITFLSVGVNFCSAPPAVPPVFWWHHEETNTTILSTWHPGGYGGDTPADLAVVGTTGFLPLWFGDNLGAPNATVVSDDLAAIRAAFPNATLVFSSFDEAAAALAADPAAASLPRLSAEIGDTWMYGVAADPLKTARTRAIYRARDAHPDLAVSETALFDLVASKLVEHTWGGDSKTFLHDNGNWSNRDFDAVRGGWNYRVMEESWAEQLAYTDLALALAPPAFADDLATAFATLADVAAPSLDGYRSLPLSPDGTALVHLPSLSLPLSFDAHGTYKTPTGGSAFTFLYATYDAADYTHFLSHYSWPWGDDGCTGDFSKVNVSTAKPLSTTWPLSLSSLWTDDVASLWLLLSPLNKSAVLDYGAPRRVYLQLNFSETEREREREREGGGGGGEWRLGLS
jgi:hypothetical protein